MFKNYFKIIFSLVIFSFLLSACGVQKNGVCHLRDSRFACHGDLNADGVANLSFDKVPSGNFQAFNFSLQKVNSDNGDSFPFADCSLKNSNNEIKNNKNISLKCPKLEQGNYYFKFSIKHYEDKNYKPRKSETCVLKNKWECTTSGEFKVEIK